MVLTIIMIHTTTMYYKVGFVDVSRLFAMEP